MTFRDTMLALLTMVMWGSAFVASRLALEAFTPLQLVCLRFSVPAILALFVARPAIPWSDLILIGATLFAGQFLLLFLGMSLGLPPGVASATQQTQACFTVLFAAIWLRDVPTLRQGVGMAVAFAGIALVGATAGTDLKPLGLMLGLAGALSWATGNILIKRLPRVPMFSLVVWASLIPPLPAFLLSYALDSHTTLLLALNEAPLWSILGALFLGICGTLGGYALWGYLLQRYPAAIVAPFSLLSPCVGVVASALLLGERFPPLRLAGMGLIVAGLAAIVLPLGPARWLSMMLWQRPLRAIRG
jgi:O-acetylserine/cysteine efflux transporter